MGFDKGLRFGNRNASQLLLDELIGAGNCAIGGGKGAGRVLAAAGTGADGRLGWGFAVQHPTRLLLFDSRGLNLHLWASFGAETRFGIRLAARYTADMVLDTDGVALRAVPLGIFGSVAGLGVAALCPRAMELFG